MRNARKLMALALTTVGVLAFTSAPAWAGHGYEKVTTTFGSEGSGPGTFKKPTAVGVNDETEDVYVLDSGNDRIEYFTSAGAYLGEFDGSGTHSNEGKAAGSGPGETLTGKFLKPGGIAIDQTNGDVYVADTGPGHEVIDKFSASGKYEGQLTGTCREEGEVPPACSEEAKRVPFVGLLNATVDASGDVWVYESNGPVEIYGTGEEYRLNQVDEISSTGTAIKGTAVKPGGESEFPGFAVDSSGDIFVAATGTLYEFPTAGERFGIKEPSSELAALAMIAANNDLLVDQGSSIELFKSPVSAGAQPILTFPTTGLSESEGIAVNGAEGDGTIYATQRGSDDVDVFDSEPAKAPQVVSERATTVEEPAGGEFTAVIDPENRETTYSFEYGSSEAEVLAGDGKKVAGETTLSAEFGDLEATSPEVKLRPAEDTFYYRAVAENKESKGTPTYGKVEAYTKLPLVENEKFSKLTSTSATLEATVNPVFEGTHYKFEYATEAALLGTAKATVVDAGETVVENGPEPVSTEISGLQPGQTYFFHVVADNAVSKNEGNANKGAPIKGPVEEVTPYAAPAVTTGGAQNITGTAATLSGEVNPEGPEATYHFAYIDKAGYEKAIKGDAQEKANPYAEGDTTATFGLPASASPEAVGPIPADDLLPGETYYYALVAVNKYAIQTIGFPQTFTTAAGTPPLVSTGGASAVSQNAATLSGTVTTNGLQTNYGFEIGTAPNSYGPATGLGAIGGAATAEVHVTLGELQPATTYYYRVTATNADGTEKGQPVSFTTPGFPTLISPPASPPLIPYISPGFPSGSLENTQSPTIKVVSHKVKGKTATIKISVPSAGKLVATGKGVSKGTGKASKAGDVTVKVSLTKKEQAFLAKHKGRKLKVDVKLVFMPASGGQLTSTTTVLLG
jgi:hypothetical protein